MSFSPVDYKRISDLIDSAQLRGSEIVSHISNMEEDLSNSEVASDNVDKLRLSNTITRNQDTLRRRHEIKSREILNLVKNLQKYIVDNYNNVNTYLSSNNIKVLAMFAEISEEVGYPIESSNIDYGPGSYEEIS